jgi:hypothetical protein
LFQRSCHASSKPHILQRIWRQYGGKDKGGLNSVLPRISRCWWDLFDTLLLSILGASSTKPSVFLHKRGYALYIPSGTWVLVVPNVWNSYLCPVADLAMLMGFIRYTPSEHSRGQFNKALCLRAQTGLHPIGT